MNLFVCLWNAPEAWRMAALDAIKRMSDVLPQLQPIAPSSSIRQHTAADTGAHPVVATIRTSDAALGQRTYVAMDGPDLVLYDGAPIDPEGQIAGSSGARSPVAGKRRRTVWKGSSSSFGPRRGRSRCSPTPSASTQSITGTGIGPGWSATASLSFGPLPASGVGIRAASARTRSPAGRGQTAR